MTRKPVIVIMDDISDTPDIPEEREKIRWWYTHSLKLPESFVVHTLPDRLGKYGCQKCGGTGSVGLGYARDNSSGVDGAAIHDVYIEQTAPCGRCLRQGVYVSRARAGLAER